MKNSWNYLHPPFKMVIFYLFWPCPAAFGKQFSEENSWNQLIKWKKYHPWKHDRTVAHFPISILNKQLIKQHLSFQTDIIPVLLTNLSFQTDIIPALLTNLSFQTDIIPVLLTNLSFQTDIIPLLLTNLSFQTDNIHVLLINLWIIFVLNWHLLKLFLSPSSCLDSITPNNHRLTR